MRLPGHAAGGLLVTELLTRVVKPASPAEHWKMLALGTVAGTLPDWDYLYYLARKRRVTYDSDFRHHTWVTHTFPFYWMLALLIFLSGLFGKKPGLKKAAAVVAASTTVHLVQDMFGSGDGIMAFYPISKQHIGVGLSGLHGREWDQNYVKTPFYLIELGLIFTAGLTILFKILHRQHE